MRKSGLSDRVFSLLYVERTSVDTGCGEGGYKDAMRLVLILEEFVILQMHARAHTRIFTTKQRPFGAIEDRKPGSPEFSKL